MRSPQREKLLQSLAALLTQPQPSVVSPEFLFESWLIMSVIIVIRHDMPEDKMFFPSAREKKKKTEKIFLPVYAVPVIFESRGTNVRDVSPPKS